MQCSPSQRRLVGETTNPSWPRAPRTSRGVLAATSTGSYFQHHPELKQAHRAGQADKRKREGRRASHSRDPHVRLDLRSSKCSSEICLALLYPTPPRARRLGEKLHISRSTPSLKLPREPLGLLAVKQNAPVLEFVSYSSTSECTSPSP